MINDFEILPGFGITNLISLGDPIVKVIEIIKDLKINLEIKLNEKEPYESDLFIHLKDLHILLSFNSSDHRLKYVDIYNFESKILKYKSKIFNSAETIPTFNLIYKIFGPTYPGI